jgi:hypothetical protein
VFERDLLAHHGEHAPRTSDDLWLVLVKRIGIDALLVVLDEIGGLKVWAPTRTQLVRRVWLDLRDREIRRLRTDGRLSTSEISAAMGVNPRTVRRVVHPGPVSAAPVHAKQRA